MTRFFLPHLFLTAIAVFILLSTLQFLVLIGLRLYRHGLSEFLLFDWPGLVGFALLILFDVWFLHGSFLPIIKIDDAGIRAYSLFWWRSIPWSEVKTAILVKGDVHKTRRTRGPIRSELKKTNTPETRRSIGARTETWIMVSRAKIKLPIRFEAQLLMHRDIADKNSIALAYDEKAWQFISEKMHSPGHSFI
jgi:hypothetical protein